MFSILELINNKELIRLPPYHHCGFYKLTATQNALYQFPSFLFFFFDRVISQQIEELHRKLDQLENLLTGTEGSGCQIILTVESFSVILNLFEL